MRMWCLADTVEQASHFSVGNMCMGISVLPETLRVAIRTATNILASVSVCSFGVPKPLLPVEPSMKECRFANFRFDRIGLNAHGAL